MGGLLVHRYADAESRVTAYSAIGLAAVGIAWSLNAITAPLSWPDWIVGVPSFAAVYALLYLALDVWGWNKSISRWLQLSTTPDVSGDYSGRIVSTYEDSDGQRVERPVHIEIRQTWTRIEVRMTVDSDNGRSSRSYSVAAAVSGTQELRRLVYYYRNQPNPGVADDDMSDHDGAAEIEIRDSSVLSGRYFNARMRRGSIDANATSRATRDSGETDRTSGGLAR